MEIIIKDQQTNIEKKEKQSEKKQIGMKNKQNKETRR